jgi:hypothetical protein
MNVLFVVSARTRKTFHRFGTQRTTRHSTKCFSREFFFSFQVESRVAQHHHQHTASEIKKNSARLCFAFFKFVNEVVSLKFFLHSYFAKLRAQLRGIQRLCSWSSSGCQDIRSMEKAKKKGSYIYFVVYSCSHHD